MLVYRTVGRAIFRGASRVAVLNDGVVDFVVAQGVAPERVFILPNGVDVERFRPPADGERAAIRARFGLPAEGVLAVFVGRFVPKKGFDKALAATSDDYKIVFIGGDPPAEAADDPRAIFLGQLSRDDLAEVYRACDLFVLPSESEGFPLTAQEAMASGLPIVITDDPGYAPYALDRKQVGWLDGSAAPALALLTELAADSGSPRRDGALCARVRALALPLARPRAHAAARVLPPMSERTDRRSSPRSGRRPPDWRVVVLRAVLVHALLGWVYIAMNALSHPWTLGLRLTHFSDWPHEGDFGVGVLHRHAHQRAGCSAA